MIIDFIQSLNKKHIITIIISKMLGYNFVTCNCTNTNIVLYRFKFLRYLFDSILRNTKLICKTRGMLVVCLLKPTNITYIYIEQKSSVCYTVYKNVLFDNNQHEAKIMLVRDLTTFHGTLIPPCKGILKKNIRLAYQKYLWNSLKFFRNSSSKRCLVGIIAVLQIISNTLK
ncbi:hypothetical protein AGLY_013125 [Aphis glycines]|uniref:Uncharacterized protein n=1 Tax=Aphis glycines TaxID=307491 RepID=A0A6G0T5L2_APHGL|nr:hypothetical protein AGLY_013125 [Aphis glycines]